mmetsp:Transcript_26273/g.49909  ORF Transcript_26273/g.49909 Transcript_26273/m.49909 type:complete len:356 (-) Transcript_26273:2687-3754(-)
MLSTSPTAAASHIFTPSVTGSMETLRAGWCSLRMRDTSSRLCCTASFRGVLPRASLACTSAPASSSRETTFSRPSAQAMCSAERRCLSVTLTPTVRLFTMPIRPFSSPAFTNSKKRLTFSTARRVLSMLMASATFTPTIWSKSEAALLATLSPPSTISSSRLPSLWCSERFLSYVVSALDAMVFSSSGYSFSSCRKLWRCRKKTVQGPRNALTLLKCRIPKKKDKSPTVSPLLKMPSCRKSPVFISTSRSSCPCTTKNISRATSFTWNRCSSGLKRASSNRTLSESRKFSLHPWNSATLFMNSRDSCLATATCRVCPILDNRAFESTVSPRLCEKKCSFTSSCTSRGSFLETMKF